MADDIHKAIASEFRFGREPMGDSNASVSNASGAASANTVLKGRGNASPDGALSGGVGKRTRVAVNASQDGAAHTIKAVRPPQVAEAAPTQANGKIVPISHRTGKNFYSQSV